MAKRHVMVAVPAYTGTVHIGTMRSLLTDVLFLAQRGDAVTLEDERGSTLIADARAEMVSRFLSHPRATHLVFIDWDVCWQAGALARLVDHPVDCVLGLYPQRADPPPGSHSPVSYALEYLDETHRLPMDPETGLVKIGGAGAGFLSCSRAMLQRMWDAYKDDPIAGLFDRNGTTSCALFESLRRPDNPRRKLGEDYSFLHRWRDIGGVVWVDPDITMGHSGIKLFIGNFKEWLQPVETEKAA